MVETLVYESPLQEEPEESAALLPYDSDEADKWVHISNLELLFMHFLVKGRFFVFLCSSYFQDISKSILLN